MDSGGLLVTGPWVVEVEHHFDIIWSYHLFRQALDFAAVPPNLRDSPKNQNILYNPFHHLVQYAFLSG